MERSKKASSLLYKKTFQYVRSILNYADPEKLSPGRKGGAPIDEYDSEVAAITAFLIHHHEDCRKSPRLLAVDIDRVWKENFSGECSDAQNIADELVKGFSIEKLTTCSCPACGFPDLDEPAFSTNGGGSDEICPCCGAQFGYSLSDQQVAVATWRERWISEGKRWRGSEPPPKGWNPDEQLKNLLSVQED